MNCIKDFTNAQYAHCLCHSTCQVGALAPPKHSAACLG